MPAPLKRRIFHFFIGVARRWGEKILNGEKVPLHARLTYWLGQALVYAPLKNRYGLSRIRVAYTAGEAIGPEIFRFYRALGINLKQLYGMTEASVYITAQPDGEVYADTVGKPNPDVDVKVDPSGEVLFRSPGVFVGYYKDPEKTAEMKTPDGWVRTGDAGFFDKRSGHLKIIDRAKDVGRLNDGTLFAPKYIENKLKFYPNIREAVAFGDKRDFVCAMLNIDLVAVGGWAERNNVVYGSYQELANHPRVYDMLAQHVEEVNRSLADERTMAGAQIRRFLILHKELDADDGELTRTQKVRRGFIVERYAPLALALYDGSAEASISTEVTFEDGRKGVLAARVRVRDLDCVTLQLRWGAPRESRFDQRLRRRSGAPLGRKRIAVVRRREGNHRRLPGYCQGRNPLHHRSERRRQDVDAQCHQRILSAAAGHASRSRAAPAQKCGPMKRPAAASPARFRTLPCSRE